MIPAFHGQFLTDAQRFTMFPDKVSSDAIFGADPSAPIPERRKMP
jgi:hypothetical protein